jgi:hypothetical protein
MRLKDLGSLWYRSHVQPMGRSVEHQLTSLFHNVLHHAPTIVGDGSDLRR